MADHRNVNNFKPVAAIASNEVRPAFDVVLASATIEAAPSVQIVEDTPSTNSQSIDLITALMLTTGRNPQIAFARARIEEDRKSVV